MTILNLVIAPNPILQQKSSPVLKITEKTKKLCNDMFETMYNFGGIGLSAVQVGILERIIVIDLQSKEDKKSPSGQIIMINPEKDKENTEFKVALAKVISSQLELLKANNAVFGK